MLQFQGLFLALPFASFLAGAAALPEQGAANVFGKVHLLGGPNGGSGPCDLDTGPDGESIWFQDLSVNKIGSYSVKTKKFSIYSIPNYATSDETAPHAGTSPTLQCWLRTGQDGNIYAGAASRQGYVKLNPKTSKITVQGAPGGEPSDGTVNAVAAANGLYIVSTKANKITFVPYATDGGSEVYTLPNAGGPLGVALDAQQNLFFTNFYSSEIGRLDPKTSAIELFAKAGQVKGPAVMRAFTKNKYLWAVATKSKSLVRIDTSTNPPSVMAIGGGPNAGTPDVDTADSQGNIWFSIPADNTIVRYAPSTAQFTTVTLTGTDRSHGNNTLPVHYGPLDRIWFTDLATGQLGYVELS